MQPRSPQHYEYPAAAEAAGLSEAQLFALEQMFAADYPNDEMLRELHILRACQAIVRGKTTIETVLSSPGPTARGNVA